MNSALADYSCGTHVTYRSDGREWKGLVIGQPLLEDGQRLRVYSQQRYDSEVIEYRDVVDRLD